MDWERSRVVVVVGGGGGGRKRKLVDKWRMVVECVGTAVNWDGEGSTSCWMSRRRREEEGR